MRRPDDITVTVEQSGRIIRRGGGAMSTLPVTRTAVVRVWEAAGEPEPNWTGKAKTARSAPPTRVGVCALTGLRGPVVDFRHVLSDLFTTWDRLPHRLHPDAGLSIPACWAFRLRVAMQRPHVLDSAGWRQATPSTLFATLTRLAPDDVVCVPQSRQKHLLPYAEGGVVRVDDETLRWDTGDADRLDLYRTLRSWGFGEAALAEPAPRWPVLQRLDSDRSRVAVTRWAELDPWRRHTAYLAVAAAATRKDPA